MEEWPFTEFVFFSPEKAIAPESIVGHRYKVTTPVTTRAQRRPSCARAWEMAVKSTVVFLFITA